jgi:Family of unknown function (DUF5993)
MMAALFLLMTLIIGGVYSGKRSFGIVLLLITLGLCWTMLWYHATDTLKINW